MSILEAKNLSIVIDENKIISNLSFKLDEGDFLCIVGENGSGKTTLIKAIIGEIQAKKGLKFSNLKRSEIGYISQRSQISENFPASVTEIVCSGSLNSSSFGLRYSKETKDKAKQALSDLKIQNLADRSFSELSGGQKQKVLLARALMATKKLIILDEPSNNLDKKSRAELYALLNQINKHGIAIIMVTHDLDHGNLIGNKILSLSGKLSFFGTVDEYVERIHHA